MDAVQALDPARRLFEVYAQFLGILLADLGLGGLAVGVVRLIVDDDQILVRGQLAEHAAHIGLIALGALPDHGLGLLLERHQAVPIVDQQFDLVELLAQGLVGADREQVVVVLRVTWLQHLQALLHCQARGDDEDRAGEVLVALRISQRVEHLPGDDHRHHRSLAAAGRHLAAQALPCTAIARNRHALLELGRRFHLPDQRLDGFELAEIEGVQAPGSPITPMLEQLPGDGGHARIVGRTPFIDALADTVDQLQLDATDGVVAGVEDLVACRPSALDQFEPAVAGALPVVGRSLEWRADDQGALVGHRVRHAQLPVVPDA